MVGAVGHCHANGIVHRDLRPDNFLASENSQHDPFAPIMLLNFRSATTCEAGSSDLKVPYGHAEYAAIEVSAKPYAGYGQPADLWSMGVILYILVCGYPPFFGNSQAEVLEMVQTAEFDFPEDEWGNGELE